MVYLINYQIKLRMTFVWKSKNHYFRNNSCVHHSQNLFHFPEMHKNPWGRFWRTTVVQKLQLLLVTNQSSTYKINAGLWLNTIIFTQSFCPVTMCQLKTPVGLSGLKNADHRRWLISTSPFFFNGNRCFFHHISLNKHCPKPSGHMNYFWHVPLGQEQEMRSREADSGN